MARRKKTINQLVEQGLKDIAFGSIGDAVSLLFMSEEDVVKNISDLQLINISEIKRPKSGGMEIKFFDRLKAMDMLNTEKQRGSESGMSFYEALEKSTQNSVGGDDN